MIPVEAVEAAARKLCALAGYDWDNIDAPDDVATDFKAQVTAQARSVLEAAAPHLMAAAWDEGYLACVDDAFRDKELGKTGQRLEDGQQNPYRKAPDA